MKFCTAGEQKFYDIAESLLKSIRTQSIICASLFSAAFVSFVIGAEQGKIQAVVLVVIGIAVTYNNLKARRNIKNTLEKAGADESFYNQLIAPDSEEFKDLSLIITKDYLVSAEHVISVFKNVDLKKVEVRQGALLIEETDGTITEIVKCSKKRTEKALHKACSAINKHIIKR